MRRPFIFAALFCFSSCADLTHEQAIALTQQYIQKHDLPLPKGYKVKVEEDEYISVHESTGPNESVRAYIITYAIHEKKLYQFTMQRNVPRIRDFEDERSMTNRRDVR
jgi:hypothetical protein